MEQEYDFSQGKRGPILTPDAAKEKISIRLDHTILEWFRDKAEASQSSYQTMINGALREYIASNGENLESTLRKVVRDEIQALKTQAS